MIQRFNTFSNKIKSKSLWGTGLYLFILALCLSSIYSQNDLSLGRKPLENLTKTIKELSVPSFVKIWNGNEHFEYKNDERKILRVDNQKLQEKKFLYSLLRSGWMTFKIATLGSGLAAIFGFLLSWPASKNLNFPKVIYYFSNAVINFFRSIHSLVFGLLLVGIVGLGPMAGILAIALHSMGSYGKLFSESIDSLNLIEANALRLSGANRIQVFFHAIWPELLPQFLSTHLYIWEFNMRDSAVLGLVGAGGIGLLLSDAVALFQWQRLSTLILFLFLLVNSFSYVSSRIRQELLA
jgi:phosphonate transport system permease protein